MPELPAYLAGSEDAPLERILEHWLGPPTHAERAAPERDGVSFPPALRRHHEIRSRWDLPLDRTHRLLRPERVGVHEHEPPTVTVFLEEEQGVQSWGFDDAGDVWTREEEEGEPWVPVGADLQHFLVGYELVEAAMGALGTVGALSAWMTPTQAMEVVAPLTPLPFPPCMIGLAPHHLLGNNDALALVGPNPSGTETPQTASGWEVWLSGRRPGALDWLADLEGVVGVDGWRDRAHVDSYDGIFWDYLRLR